MAIDFGGAAWREIGYAPYLASLRIDQLHSLPEFLDASSYMRLSDTM